MKKREHIPLMKGERMHHIAQVNIARALAPLDDPLLADFAAHLDQIYKLAESSLGFIWRLRAEDIPSTSPDLPSDERLFATLSVWASLESLRAFVYKSAHAQMMRRRREWFLHLHSPYIAL
jgi:heme-degrading monooxygenase HmoA